MKYFIRFFKHYKSCYKAHRHGKEVERYQERRPRRRLQHSTGKAVNELLMAPSSDCSEIKEDKIDVYVTDLTGQLRYVSSSTVLWRSTAEKYPLKSISLWQGPKDG